MQIGSGQSSLSLALLKALGAQAPAASETAAAVNAVAKPAASAAESPAGVSGATGASAETLPDLGVAKSIPRGSFVDIKC